MSDRGGPPPYVRVAPLAVGGMGYVELVVRREGSFERLYARKRIHVAMREDAAFRAMFAEEARLAGLVRHPNLVGVLDVGEDEEGPFLIMDYVDGVPVAALLDTSIASTGPTPIQIALRIVAQAARGLHAAHEARSTEGNPVDLVHRDVSPRNILCGFDGSVRIADFGIAKAAGNAVHTATGVLKGNAGYMAPEQLRLEAVDRRADLFALGVVLFELLAGRRLYGSEGDVPSAVRIQREPPPDVGHHRRDVPLAVTELLFEMLAKEPRLRPTTAQDVANRLDEALAELVTDTGTDDLIDFLESRAGDARRRRQRELVEPLARARETAQVPRRRRGTMALAAAAAFLFLGLGTIGIRAALRSSQTITMGPLPAAPSLWAGGWHSCAREGPRLSCWGKNNHGQLGVGDRADHDRPQRVIAVDERVVDLALGWFHTCACTARGVVVCWGRNDEGQLGAPPQTPGDGPRVVAGVQRCAQVVAGDSHTCVRDAAGQVTCWGDGREGQTAGPLSAGNVPAAVVGIEHAVHVSAQGGTTCAVLADGRVTCWGRGSKGQLGDGKTTAARPSPTAVPGIGGGIAVAVGQGFACLLERGGASHCWGVVGENKLGISPERILFAPTRTPLVSDAIRMSAGASHYCVVRRSGSVACAWSNYFGQLGNGTERSFSGAPERVIGLEGAVEVAAGAVHTCARDRHGVSCWGFGESGQLGNGSRQVASTQASVLGLHD